MTRRTTDHVAPTRTMLSLAAMLVMVTLGAGCANNHEKWVNDADNRWNEMRSAIKYDIAEQRFNTGDLDQAELEIKEAMARDPENVKLLTLAGRIGLERGQLERAYHLFARAIEIDTPTEEELEKDETLKPRHAECRYYQGVVFERWQRMQTAYEMYSEAYEIESDNPGYLTAKCEMLVNLDRVPEAIELLESKLNYFDQHAGVRASLAHLLVIDGQHDRAATYFAEAALLDPDSSKMREELALSQYRAEQYRDAATTLSDLLDESEYRDRDDLMRLHASALQKSSQPSKARAVYVKLTRMPAAQASDWIKLGELAWQAGDLGGTATAAQRAIRLAPDQHEGYLLAGMVWQKRGKTEEALSAFDRAAAAAPDNAAPLILRGITLQKAGRNNAAAEAYRDALKRAPDDTRAQKLLDSLARSTAAAPTAVN